MSSGLGTISIYDVNLDGNQDVYFGALDYPQGSGYYYLDTMAVEHKLNYLGDYLFPPELFECDGSGGNYLGDGRVIDPVSGDWLNYFSSGCVLVTYQLGTNGVYQHQVFYNPNLQDNQISQFEMGDFNGDNRLDFFDLLLPDMEFTVHLRTAGGGYDLVNIDISDFESNSIHFFIRDMDSDGVDEIIMSGRKNGQKSVTQFKFSSGNFIATEAIQDFSFSRSQVDSGYLSVGDFDDNGLNDFVIMRGAELKLVSQTQADMFSETGLGFSDNDIERTPFVLFVDEDGDGDKDIIYLYETNNSTDVIKIENTGGQFDNKSLLIASPYEIVQLFFNETGEQRFVATLSSSSNSDNDVIVEYKKVNGVYEPEILANHGLLKFSDAQDPIVNYIDVDSDHDQDILIADTFQYSQLYLYRNAGGSYRRELLLELSSSVRDFKVTDLNGDGEDDLLIAAKNFLIDGDSKEDQIHIYSFINENGQFNLDGIQSFNGFDGRIMKFADIEGDGDYELFITDRLWLKNQNGTFDLPQQVYELGSPIFFNMQIEDLDGDGISEYIWVNGSRGPFTAIDGLSVSKYDETTSSFTHIDSYYFDAHGFYPLTFPPA